MQISTNRSEAPQEIKSITVHLGDSRFRISESIDGKLTINKILDSDNSALCINPRYSNEIEIS